MTTAVAVSRLTMGQGSLLGDGDELAEDAGGIRRDHPQSLDGLIVDTWEGLVRGTSQCPVCGGRMEPEYGAHTRPVGGRCADCGSALH
jgi:tRNA(Ile2) C34 agmatinyltransferase TiaS